jgi:tungstate transport system ATP-binding protein
MTVSTSHPISPRSHAKTTNPSAAAYSLRKVVKAYGNRTVLQIDKLAIAPGETFALVGPSGAGKSTLLRLLALLEPPSSGELHLNIDGQPANHATATIAQRRHIGFVFQQPTLLTRSVRKNIAYGLQLRGERNWRPLVDDLIDSLQLMQVADAPAQTLSGGEKQRVAIARALVLKPQILILDEPTANLDPFNIRIIESLIRERCQDTTIIMVTHNIFQAKRLADRVGLILDGELIETGLTPAFFDAPQDPRTTAFLNGDMIY